jgi:CrcB protein
MADGSCDVAVEGRAVHDELRENLGPDDERRRIDQPDLLDEPVLPLLGLSGATLVAVFVGGALGTVGRYLLEVHHPHGASSFPWVTLLVNLSGSLAIGALLPLSEHVAHRAAWVRPFVVVGFLGGWTTYSTLAVDAVALGQHGQVGTAVAYLVATVAGGLLLVVAGHALGRRLVGA